MVLTIGNGTGNALGLAGGGGAAEEPAGGGAGPGDDGT